MLSDRGGRLRGVDDVFDTLEQAQQHPDGLVLFEGVEGALYAVVPARLVMCPERQLRLVALFLSADDRFRAVRIRYETAPVGSRMLAPFGGGAVLERVWTNPEVVGAVTAASTARLLAAPPRTVGAPAPRADAPAAAPLIPLRRR